MAGTRPRRLSIPTGTTTTIIAITGENHRTRVITISNSSITNSRITPISCRRPGGRASAALLRLQASGGEAAAAVGGALLAQAARTTSWATLLRHRLTADQVITGKGMGSREGTGTDNTFHLGILRTEGGMGAASKSSRTAHRHLTTGPSALT